MTPRLALCLLSLAACSGSNPSDGQPPPGETAIALQQVVSGLASPVHLASPAGDARLCVVEQPGRIRVVENGALLPTPFLDITDRVGSGGERGLLSVAFHPQYASNGFFFVNYTDRAGDTRVERYHVSADRNRADPASARLVIGIDQPYANHNGGLVAFGPDGRLYIGMGDGGGAAIRWRRGRTPRSCWASCCAWTWTARPRTPSRRTTRTRGARTGGRRSGRWACATRGASAGTARPACCTWRTWGRTGWRRWTWCPRRRPG
jgi:glucose/arabinose dehydrogenase